MRNVTAVWRPVKAQAILAISIASVSQGVWPQSTGAERVATLEEVLVTASKREASVQDVAISLSAVSGTEMRRYNQDNIASITVQTPSMAYSEAAGEAQIYIRGIGTNIFGVGADPSVGVHLDGVYQGRTQLALNQFLDIERVEVLRGPQGTLYGRNTTAGAINILSRRPEQERDGFVKAGIGEWSRRELTGAMGGGLSDTVSARIAGRYMKDDGFTENINPNAGVDVDDNDIKQLRGSLRFRPTETVDLTIIADWTDFKNGNTSVRPRDALGAADVLGAQTVPPFGKIRNDLDSFNEWDTVGVTAHLDWQLSPALTLTSITGYREYSSDFLFNTDGTEVDITRTNYNYDNDQISQEFRLAYDNDGRLRMIAGVFYLEEDKSGALGLIRAGGRPLFATVPGSTGSFIIPSTNKTTAYAAFAEASYGLTDQLDLIVGARYSWERKRDTSSVGAVFDLLGLRSPATPVVFSRRDDSEKWTDFAPKLGLEYRPVDNTLVYVTWSEAFKSGGFNSLDANPSFDPEEIRAWEAGIKSDWLDNRLRANATVFYYDYQDLQVSTFINNLTLTTNAAAATIKGFEAELMARPTPNWEFGLTLSVLDAEYDEFLDRQGNNPDGSPRVLDLAGNTMPNAPKYKANLQGAYTHDFVDGSYLTLTARYSFQSKLYFTQFNERVMAQGSFGLLDATASWVSADGLWELTAVGRNLGDKDYFHTGVRFTSTSAAQLDPLGIGNALGYPAPGRSWGLSLTRNF